MFFYIYLSNNGDTYVVDIILLIECASTAALKNTVENNASISLFVSTG